MTAAAVAQDPLLHRYVPRGAALALMHDRRDEILLSGPAGTGKSRAALQKVLLLMLLNPGAKGLIVRKTAASLASSAVKTWETYVIPELLANGTVIYFGGSSREPPQYQFNNGSSVVLGGMDKATRHMSTEYDVIFVQEAIELSEHELESLTTRLRNGVISFQQLIADTNPDVPQHWLIQRCNRGQTVLYESRHEDNPIYVGEDGQYTPAGRDYILGKLDKLSGVRHKRLRLGLWVAAEGQIYEEWDPAIHLTDRFPIPWEWPRYWVVDFGFSHPFVLQRWAEDPDGRLFMYAEIYRTQRLVEDHARDVLRDVSRPAPTGDDAEPQPNPAGAPAGWRPRLVRVEDELREWVEPVPQAIICDHDAEDRATLERHLGLPTTKANKSVSPGIQAVKARLAEAGDGRRRLYLLRDSCTHRDPELEDAKLPACTAEEVPGYVWKRPPAATANRPGGVLNQDEPVKKDDHGVDNIRYLVAHVDLKGRTKVHNPATAGDTPRHPGRWRRPVQSGHAGTARSNRR